MHLQQSPREVAHDGRRALEVAAGEMLGANRLVQIAVGARHHQAALRLVVTNDRDDARRIEAPRPPRPQLPSEVAVVCHQLERHRTRGWLDGEANLARGGRVDGWAGGDLVPPEEQQPLVQRRLDVRNGEVDGPPPREVGGVR